MEGEQLVFFAGSGPLCCAVLRKVLPRASRAIFEPERTPRDESVCCGAPTRSQTMGLGLVDQRRVNTGAHSTRLETRTKESIVITSSMVRKP